MESLGLLQQQESHAAALERLYSNSNPLLQGVEPEPETDSMQKQEKGGEGLRKMPASLRSPLAGDLASPQYHITLAHTNMETSNSAHLTTKVRRPSVARNNNITTN